MVIRGHLDGQTITLSLKRGALTLALDEQTVLAYDRAGRLWSFYAHGHHFRRGLNGSVLAKWKAGGIRKRFRLGCGEADLIIHRAALIANQLNNRLRFDARADVTSSLKKILARAAAYDVPAARADMEHYHQVYKPIGILPPDQYLALVLQVTEGCSFNTCTFCSFYKNRPFRIKSPEELQTHIRMVHRFLGDSVLLRKGVFLADANALVVPQAQLTQLLQVIGAEMGETPDIYAFVDGFSGEKKSAADYRVLGERGLRRVYVGLESGHDPLLRWVHKPGRAADAVAAVRQMKAGGLQVGVIVMLGIGGDQYARGHIQDTISVLNQMRLGPGDVLYFSEFFSEGTLYESNVSAADLCPLPPERMQVQQEAIVTGLSFGAERPRIATYDIREFVY